MHLVLNNRDFSNPLGGGAVPFLSIGAAENRGNGFSAGDLNDATRPSRVAFTSRLWAVGPGTLQNWVVGHYVYATAEWGGIQRWGRVRKLVEILDGEFQQSDHRDVYAARSSCVGCSDNVCQPSTLRSVI
jgi:hypothetical protein